MIDQRKSKTHSRKEKIQAFYRQGMGWFVNNPILAQEFFKYMRGGQFFVVLGLLLLIGSLAVSLFWGVKETSSFPAGRQLFYYLAGGELLAVLLILPALVSHSLILEREKNTLSLLLSTPVGPTKILIGKLVSTLGIMILFLIASYPLVSVCIARGGVSPWEVGLWAVGILYFSFIIACFSLYHAISAKTLFRSMLATHVSIVVFYLLILFVFTFAIGMVMGVYSVVVLWFQQVAFISSTLEIVGKVLLSGLGGIGFFVVTAIAVGFFYFAQKGLCEYEPSQNDPWKFSPHTSFQVGQEIRTTSNRKEVKPKWNLENNRNPYYFREKLGFHSTRPPFSLPSWYLIAVLSHLMFVFTAVYEGRLVAVFALFFIMQMVPLYAAGLFAGERDNHTWDLLIPSVFQPWKFYAGKIQGAMYQSGLRALAFFYPPVLLAVFLVTIFVTNHEPIPLPTFVHLAYYSYILVVQWLFINILGSFLSLTVSGVNRVMVLTWGILLGYTLIPYGLIPLVERYPHSLVYIFIKSLSPLVMLFLPLGQTETLSLFLTHGLIYIPISFMLYAVGYWFIRKVCV